MECFPVISRHHLNRIPGAAVEKRAVGTFTSAFLAANTEIWIDFNAAEGRMVLVRNPKHAGFDGTILNTRRRARAPGTTVGGNCQNTRSLFTRCLAVAH